MAAPDDRGRRLLAVTNAIVALHREFYGRGASRGRTIMEGDYVVCFLEDIYTKAERTLIEAGRFEEVLKSRQAFQDAMAVPFKQVVEEALDRPVVAFLSQVGANPDVGVEAFWLKPQEDGSPD